MPSSVVFPRHHAGAQPRMLSMRPLPGKEYAIKSAWPWANCVRRQHIGIGHPPGSDPKIKNEEDSGSDAISLRPHAGASGAGVGVSMDLALGLAARLRHRSRKLIARSPPRWAARR